MPDESRVGDVLASKYRLEELLGSGGMGHVYRAVNVEIDRTVAIKVLRSEHTTNAQLVERFLREARAANLVRHPNVVDVVDIGRDDGGSPFIVQELLRGEDLSKFVAARGGKLTPSEIEELVLPVIDAVAEAHTRGVVHRDLKPENVFLADQGKRRVPKLLDFGISKVRAPNIKLTEVGIMMGTPAYMAPEQIQGARDADPRADIWALGIMLFELIVGRLPFDAEDAPALFYAVATTDVPRLLDVSPGVDPKLSKIVERCVRRSAGDRYPTALELARDLRHLFEGSDIEATIARPIDLESLGLPRNRDVPSPRLDDPPTRHWRPPPPLVLEAPAQEAAAPIALAPISEPFALGPLEPPGVRVARLPRVRAEESASSGPDTAHLAGISVVALTAIVVMAVLTSVAHSPEGWPLLSLLTKPTPMASLAVHGGLGGAAFVFGARTAVTAVKKWRGDLTGGRGAAMVSAIFAGALFFAALQLTRAAW